MSHKLYDLAYEIGYANANDGTDMAMPKPSSVALEQEMRDSYFRGVNDARGGSVYFSTIVRAVTPRLERNISIHPNPRKSETLFRKRRQHLENVQARVEAQRQKKVWPGIGLHANAKNAAKN